MAYFDDRIHAGQLLARALPRFAGDLLVLGLPRGGVPVAYEVAHSLSSPLDVFIVRKLGVPGQEELAMGAIASGGIEVLNAELIADLGISPAQVQNISQREARELERREALYRHNRPPLQLNGRTVILVDDGLATGSTMRAAVKALRTMLPKRIVVAVPVASAEAYAALKPQVDELNCLYTPAPFFGVGQWFEDFTQTTDEQVQYWLKENAAEQSRLQLQRERPRRSEDERSSFPAHPPHD